MSRLSLPAEADMTPRQKEVVDMVTSGPRGGVRGPFGAWLRSPDFAAIAQDLGAHVRFRSCLNDRVREVVICTTAASIRAQYEWFAHARIALEAGVSNETLEAIRTNATPTDLPKDEAMAYTFAEELLRTKRVSDATYASAVAEFEEEGVVEIVGACGYYTLVGLPLNVADVALP
ncbi:MAG: carboxymuconolactone decarboxylase family protein, partial [Alphaproteobacteria bacterium]